MTTSPRWRTVLASAATATALAAAALAGLGVAHAQDHPHPPHPTKTAYPPHPTKTPYPPKPKPTKSHKPHHKGQKRHDHDDPGYRDDDYQDDDYQGAQARHEHHGSKSHRESERLANTGNDDGKLALGGVAAALVAAGVGTKLIARRRRSS